MDSGALSKTRSDKWILDSQLHACSDVSQREDIYTFQGNPLTRGQITEVASQQRRDSIVINRADGQAGTKSSLPFSLPQALF